MAALSFGTSGKAWVGLIGSLLTFAVPYVVTISTNFPQPWPAVVGGVVALLTMFGVYHAPYQPTTPTVPVTPPPAPSPDPTSWPGD